MPVQLPDPFTAGPFESDAEFQEFKTDQEDEAQAGGFACTVQRKEQNGQIFAEVTFQQLPPG